MKDLIAVELRESADLLEKFLSSEETITRIESAAQLLVESIKSGGKILACGNGGSACDAMHFAEEMTGRFRENREPLPALAISDPAHITCVANDYGFKYAFSRTVKALGAKNDVLLAISTSGNSENVLLAAEVAKQKGIKIIALTGKNGGKLAEYADICINVPHTGYSDRIQEIHIKVIHIFIFLIEKSLV